MAVKGDDIVCAIGTYCKGLLADVCILVDLSYVPSGIPRVVRELLYLAAVYGGLFLLKYDMTALF